MIKVCNPDGSLRHGEQRCETGAVIVAEKPDADPALCSRSVVHAYESPEQAEIMRYLHDYEGAVVAYECDGDVVISDGTKIGCRSITVGQPAELPTITAEQRVAIAILLAWPRARKSWRRWARRWLSREDRSAVAAWAAERAAWVARAEAAARAARAAERAAWVARAEVVAALAAGAAALAAAEAAAWAAERAAERAAWVARAEAVADGGGIDITATVRRVLETPDGEWPRLLDALGEEG